MRSRFEHEVRRLGSLKRDAYLDRSHLVAHTFQPPFLLWILPGVRRISVFAFRPRHGHCEYLSTPFDPGEKLTMFPVIGGLQLFTRAVLDTP